MKITHSYYNFYNTMLLKRISDEFYCLAIESNLDAFTCSAPINTSKPSFTNLVIIMEIVCSVNELF